MDRSIFLEDLASTKIWDVIIIGGGASGLGAAVDSAQRGYKTLLLEKNDFAKGTSSRSTKLIHGGVRYLQNGDISLVVEALKERGIMKKNAPQMIKDMSFVIPFYDWWNSPLYGLGLKVYDMMAGKLGLGPSELLDKQETMSLINNVNKVGLRGGVIYHDGQFDDSRMAISLARTASELGATVLNYVEVTNLIKENDLISGLEAIENESRKKFIINGKVIINATGVFSDRIIQMDNQELKPMIRPSQGVHVVLEKEFLDGPHAIMIPHTTDGRVLFAVPWHKHVVLGTTDTPIDETLDEPKPRDEEIDFILANAGQYMTKKPKRKDVKSVFAGLRPLAANQGSDTETKEISRHHKINVSTSGLISILGGKWTTYRKMAEDAINTASMVGGLKDVKCRTHKLKLSGYDENIDFEHPLHAYGSDASTITANGEAKDNESLSRKFYITKNLIIWSIQKEMAIHLDDILARRIRCLFLDADETKKIAPIVAKIMAEYLNKNDSWIIKELFNTNLIIKNYTI